MQSSNQPLKRGRNSACPTSSSRSQPRQSVVAGTEHAQTVFIGLGVKAVRVALCKQLQLAML